MPQWAELQNVEDWGVAEFTSKRGRRAGCQGRVGVQGGMEKMGVDELKRENAALRRACRG